MNWKSLKKDLSCRLQSAVLENEALSLHTTYKIGGPASLFVCPAGLEDLETLARMVLAPGVPFALLGGGANLLVSDAGIDGVVIQLGWFSQLEWDQDKVCAGAGLALDTLIVSSLRKGLGGLERLSGIPGTLGGALRMNAGAFESEIADHLLEVEIMERNGNRCRLKKEQAGFGYRQALQLRDKIIMSAVFQLRPDKAEDLWKIRFETLARRFQRQPWQYPSAGSVFKRPPGFFAGKLIEEAGLKGCRIGQAQFSPKHAGFIVNLGGAKAGEVFALIRMAQEKVKSRQKIDLELEQQLWGFSNQV
jgi:UDP-N-acetylmuramate dehydrogenase